MTSRLLALRICQVFVLVLSGRFLAVRAEPPEGDFCLVDRETDSGRGLQARSVPDDAVDVCDRTAPAAHDVVMIACDPALITRATTSRLDPADQPSGGKSGQGLVTP
jgi:hypothetical protein